MNTLLRVLLLLAALCLLSVPALAMESAFPVPFEDPATGLYGYRAADGEVAIPPSYPLAEEFSEQGLAAVADEQGWAYIDVSGEIVVRPFIFDNGPDYFSQGLARYTDNDLFGFFDESGAIIIPAQFDFAEPFSQGLAAVCQGCTLEPDGEHSVVVGGQWGCIDKTGQLVVPFGGDTAQCR